MKNEFLLTTITVSQTHWDLKSFYCQHASANWTSNPCTSVYFHAQRIGIYDGLNTGISFNKININLGNTLDTLTGVFVAPDVSGKYFFSSTQKIQMQSWRTYMVSGTGLNWRKLVENRRISYCTPWNAMSIQSTLQLGRADQVKIVLLLGKTHDADGNNLTIIMSAGCKRKISFEHEKMTHCPTSIWLLTHPIIPQVSLNT